MRLLFFFKNIWGVLEAQQQMYKIPVNTYIYIYIYIYIYVCVCVCVCVCVYSRNTHPDGRDYNMPYVSPMYVCMYVCMYVNKDPIFQFISRLIRAKKLQNPFSPVGLGYRIHRLFLCRGVRPLSNRCTKQSDVQPPVTLEFQRMQSTPSLPLLPAPLWPRCVMVKTLDSGIVVREFKLQSRYYVHFWANILWERYEPLYPPIYGLNSTTNVFLRGFSIK